MPPALLRLVAEFYDDEDVYACSCAITTLSYALALAFFSLLFAETLPFGGENLA